MNDAHSQEDTLPAFDRRTNHTKGTSFEYRWFRRLVVGVTVLALISALVLLLCDAKLFTVAHPPISAIPLLVIGIAYLGFQALVRPRPMELFRALIVSAAFILWGVDQLLPAGWSATTLGDVVITLYVIDLGWMILERSGKTRRR